MNAAENGNDGHTSSAFLFADRKDWNNALSHAKASGDKTLYKLIEWEYLLDPDAHASFDEIAGFVNANPGWPEQKRLHIRAEMTLRELPIGGNAAVIRWFGDDMPITGTGKMALAQALMDSPAMAADRVTYLIRDAWRNGDFDETTENQILTRYQKLIRRDDHVQRADRLLWDGKLEAAKRMLTLVPSEQRRLFEARIALQDDSHNAVSLVSDVPPSLRQNPGLLYDRLRFRQQHDDREGVREILLTAPEVVPYPEKWWKYREMQVHRAIDENDFELARKLIAHHGQVDGIPLSEAMWLQGWIELNMNQPKIAYDLFSVMYESVKFPTSRARAAYWTARAAEKLHDSESADAWYKLATNYPTTFYGQLAHYKRGGNTPLTFPSEPSVSEHGESELVHAAMLCIKNEELDVAKKLIQFIGENSTNDQEVLQAAMLGKRTGRLFLSVQGSKRALQRNFVLIKAGYPLPATPANVAVERPFALAIARQESEFDPHATSPSGALGVMQLLPGTAKETAHKNDLPYTRDKLFEPGYNFTIGSLYLSRMVNSYSGSYVMAIAAYNAGPGNVRNWVDQFGSPGNSVDSAVDWIERIPFTETRTYVQRVLENLEVYRYLDSRGPAKMALADDLVR